MAEFEALSKLLGSTQSDAEPSQDKGEDDDMVGEDSSGEVFSAAGQEAFEAIKANDAKGFTEALRTMIGAM